MSKKETKKQSPDQEQPQTQTVGEEQTVPPEQELGQPGVGSILLPDVLRLRQQAAVEEHRQGSRPAGESPLVWAKPGQDAPEGLERARQSLSRLVSRTLEENLARRGQGGRTPGAYGAARPPLESQARGQSRSGDTAPAQEAAAPAVRPPRQDILS